MPVFGKKASLASFNASKTFQYTEDDPELFRNGFSIIPARDFPNTGIGGGYPSLSRKASKISKISDLRPLSNMPGKSLTRGNAFPQ